jgi:hypothetical protein
MKTTILKGNLLLLFLSMLFVVSCQQQDEVTPANDQEEETILEDVSVNEAESDDVLEITAMAEADVSVSSGGRVAHLLCATVTKDIENKQIIIDFGDGCIGPRGRLRSGKIIITYSSEIGDDIANRIITFENYFVNKKGITGTIELRDISKNDEGNWVCTKRIAIKITFPNGQSMTLEGSRTREWIAGAGDDDPTNNVFRLTGSLTGTSTTGRSFSTEITVPVIVDWSCAAQGLFARIAGVIEMKRLGGFGERIRTINYGDGNCDNEILISTIRRIHKIIVKG